MNQLTKVGKLEEPDVLISTTNQGYKTQKASPHGQAQILSQNMAVKIRQANQTQSRAVHLN